MFVQLENTVEGLVSLVSLTDDYYVFDEKQMILMGERTRKTYHIGDEITVKLENVDIVNREIDFSIVEDTKEEGKDD